MATEKDTQATQQIAELETSIYQIRIAIAEKTAMKSKLEERNTKFQSEKRNKRTEMETGFQNSINQIQDEIDAMKSKQGLLQSQMCDTTSIEKKAWLKESIDNMQKMITHFEEGLKGRQNNLSEIDTVFSQLEQDFVNKQKSIADLENNIDKLEEELRVKQNALSEFKAHL